MIFTYTLDTMNVSYFGMMNTKIHSVTHINTHTHTHTHTLTHAHTQIHTYTHTHGACGYDD